MHQEASDYRILSDIEYKIKIIKHEKITMHYEGRCVVLQNKRDTPVKNLHY